MQALTTILKRAKKGLEPGWLFLPRDEDWGLETKGIIIDSDGLDDSQLSRTGEPVIAQERGLTCTLESAAIEDIVAFAAESGTPVTAEFLLESFLYYNEYDAFLPHPGFKPLDNSLYEQELLDNLDEERLEVPCQKNGCNRGAISLSVMCKTHHIEMMNKNP